MDPPPTSSAKQLPIADLSPSLESLSSSSIKAVVSLIWPYSSSTRAFGFLLAEPDVRRRSSSKGQVRVNLHGSSAKAAAESRVGIDDVVILRLEGVDWKQHDGTTGLPGKCLDWDLEFTEKIYLEVYRDDQRFATIDVDHPPTSPLPQRPLPLPIPSEVRLRSPPRNGFNESLVEDGSVVLSSPAFLKHPRLSSGPFLNTSLDPFADDDGYILGKGRKRSKLSQVEDNRTDEVGTPEPTGVPVETSSLLPSHGGNEDSTMLSTMEDAQTQTTFVAEENPKATHDEDPEMSDLPKSIAEYLRPADRDQKVAKSIENGHAELPQNTLAKVSSPELDTDVAEVSGLLQETAPMVSKNPVRTLEGRSEELGYWSEEEDEIPYQMPTPRLGPPTSPGLPLISPLIKRSGPPGSYFQFPPKHSELDGSGSSPPLESLPLLPFEPVPQLVVQASASTDPIISDPFKKPDVADTMDGLEVINKHEGREDANEDSDLADEDDGREDIDQESGSDDGYVEQEPGSIEFESLRSDVPLVRESLEEQEFEDEDSENDQVISDEELSSSFEGFSTPGELLRGGENEDQMSGKENVSGAEDAAEEIIMERAFEDEKRAAALQERLPEPESEENEIGAKEPLELPVDERISDEEMADAEGAEGQSEEDLEAQEELEAAMERGMEQISDGEGPEDMESEDGEMESDVEEPEAPSNQTLQVPTTDAIIDLTEDSDEEGGSPESYSEMEGMPGDREDEFDEEEQQSDDGFEGIEDHGDGEDLESRLSGSPRFSGSASVDEQAIGQEEDIPTSPVFRELSDADDQLSDEDNGERSQHEQLDAHTAFYPELPTQESENAGLVEESHPKLSLSNLAQQAAEVSDMLIDPQLSNQLMTPSATATASQLTALLSRESTGVIQEEQHDLPTGQDTQTAAVITLIHTRHSSKEEDVGENAPEPPEPRPNGAKTRQRRSVGVSDAVGKWFELRRSSQSETMETHDAASEEEIGREEDDSEEEAEQDPGDGDQDVHEQEQHKHHFAEVTEQHLKERIEAIPDSAFQLSTYPPKEPKGLTTPHAYFPPLSLLASHFNETLDVLTVCTTDSPKAERAKKGPKDYFTTFTLTDPSSLSTSQNPDSPPQAITVVQIFRPDARALPTVTRGDVVLLRAFKVQTQKHKIMLLSTKESAWVVFKHGPKKRDKVEEILSGPPVEFGAEERGVVKGLWSWWKEVGEKGVEENEKEGHALRRALKPADVAEPEPDNHAKGLEKGGHSLRRGSLKPTDVIEKTADDHEKGLEKGGYSLRNRGATEENEEKSEKEAPKRGHARKRKGGTEEVPETVVEEQEKGGHALRNRSATEEAVDKGELENDKGGYVLRTRARARTPRGGFAAVIEKG